MLGYTVLGGHPFRRPVQVSLHVQRTAQHGLPVMRPVRGSGFFQAGDLRPERGQHLLQFGQHLFFFRLPWGGQLRNGCLQGLHLPRKSVGGLAHVLFKQGSFAGGSGVFGSKPLVGPFGRVGFGLPLRGRGLLRPVPVARGPGDYAPARQAQAGQLGSCGLCRFHVRTGYGQRNNSEAIL